MGPTQITLREIEMKEGWMDGRRRTDGQREGRGEDVGLNGPQGKSKEVRVKRWKEGI